MWVPPGGLLEREAGAGTADFTARAQPVQGPGCLPQYRRGKGLGLKVFTTTSRLEVLHT